MRVRWIVRDQNGKFVGTELLPRPASNFAARTMPHPARSDWTLHRVWEGQAVGYPETRLV